MRAIFWGAVLAVVTFSTSAQNPETFIQSIDPNPQNMYQADKGYNIWSIGDYVYVVNGYIWNAQLDRRQDIFKIDANTREIVKRIDFTGPQGDIAIVGFWDTPDQQILLTGEWRDYVNTRMRTFIAKLDKDLEVLWIKYYPESELSEQHVYGEAITETSTGDILLYLAEGGGPPVPQLPWANSEGSARVVKTDATGQIVFSKVLPDTFTQTIGYGHMMPTADGNFFLTSMVVGYYYHPLYGTYRNNTILHKFDSDANLIWSRMLGYAKFPIQEPVATALLDGSIAVMWAKDTFTPDPAVDPSFNLMYGFDGDGKRIWSHEWNDLATRQVNRIITAQNGDILGVGYYIRGAQKGKGWLFRMTAAGEVLWERHYSDSIQRPWSPQLELLDLCEMEDGRIAATGIIFDSTDLVGAFNLNAALLVVDANGCMEPNCSGLNQYITSALEPLYPLPALPVLSILPNPASDWLTVRIPDVLNTAGRKLELRCHNTQGQPIQRMAWADPQLQQTMDCRNWPSGTYHLILTERGRPIAIGKALVRH